MLNEKEAIGIWRRRMIPAAFLHSTLNIQHSTFNIRFPVNRSIGNHGN
jgi:hypothetical protein